MKFCTTATMIFAVGAMILGTSNGLKCYDCLSSKNPLCNDDFFSNKTSSELQSSISTVDCNEAFAYCVKQVHSYSKVSRGCSTQYSGIHLSLKSNGECDRRRGGYTACLCKGDYCNEAGRMKIAAVLGFIPLNQILSNFFSS